MKAACFPLERVAPRAFLKATQHCFWRANSTLSENVPYRDYRNDQIISPAYPEKRVKDGLFAGTRGAEGFSSL